MGFVNSGVGLGGGAKGELRGGFSRKVNRRGWRERKLMEKTKARNLHAWMKGFDS